MHPAYPRVCVNNNRLMSGQIFQMKSDKIMPRLCIEPAYRSIGDEIVSDRVSISIFWSKKRHHSFSSA